MGDAIHGVELSERLSRIETILEVISKSLDDSQPRIIYLEKELERQKDSLKQAHHRIDELNTRFQWTLGACITIVGIIVGVCFK